MSAVSATTAGCKSRHSVPTRPRSTFLRGSVRSLPAGLEEPAAGRVVGGLVSRLAGPFGIRRNRELKRTGTARGVTDGCEWSLVVAAGTRRSRCTALLLFTLGFSSLIGRPLSERRIGKILPAAISLGLLSSIAMLVVMVLQDTRHVTVELGNWIEIPHYHFSLKLQFDRLSLPFVLLSYVLVGLSRFGCGPVARRAGLAPSPRRGRLRRALGNGALALGARCAFGEPSHARGVAAADRRCGEVGVGAFFRLAAPPHGRPNALERDLLRGAVRAPGRLFAVAVQPRLGMLAVGRAAVVSLGLVTAVFAALAARVQTDIKGDLSFASLIQVGIIVAEIGLGLRYFALVHMLGNASSPRFPIPPCSHVAPRLSSAGECLGSPSAAVVRVLGTMVSGPHPHCQLSLRMLQAATWMRGCPTMWTAFLADLCAAATRWNAAGRISCPPVNRASRISSIPSPVCRKTSYDRTAPALARVADSHSGARPPLDRTDSRCRCAPRTWSLAFSAAALVCAVGAWQDLYVLHAAQAEDFGHLIRRLTGHDVLVLDELSAPLLPLAALLYFLTAVATPRPRRGDSRSPGCWLPKRWCWRH